MNQFAGQKLRHRCRDQTYGHQGEKVAGGGGGGVMKWEIGIDMYTLMCIKWMTNKNLLYQKINKRKNIKIKIKMGSLGRVSRAGSPWALPEPWKVRLPRGHGLAPGGLAV